MPNKSSRDQALCDPPATAYLHNVKSTTRAISHVAVAVIVELSLLGFYFI